MKYAVKVKNKEEQNYVSMKLNNEIYINRWNYITNDNDIFDEYKNVISNGYEIITFEEFKSRYELKIGDTFEYNGFVCEVKEEIKKWYKSENAYVRTEPMKAEGWTEITNKEFIKQ